MTLNARYNRASYIVGAFLLTIVSISAHAFEVPPLKSHINDYASILSADTKSNLESQLAALESTDSTQVVVLTIPSLEGEVLEEFSIKVAEKWKIGQKKLDNGVILLISKMDRKIRIEVGRGLEGKLTDLISGRIIRYEITPKFKNGDYDGGVAAGVSAIIATIKGEYIATKKVEYKASWEKNEVITVLEIFLLIVSIPSIIIFSIMFFLMMGYLVSKKFSKVFVISCGVIVGIAFTTIHSIYFPLPGSSWWIDVPFVLIFWFLPILGFALNSGGSSRFSSGGSSNSIFSGSSSFSSSSSSSFSSSSSSFSGGGGSFGGGGATGSW